MAFVVQKLNHRRTKAIPSHPVPDETWMLLVSTDNILVCADSYEEVVEGLNIASENLPCIVAEVQGRIIASHGDMSDIDHDDYRLLVQKRSEPFNGFYSAPIPLIVLSSLSDALTGEMVFRVVDDGTAEELVMSLAEVGYCNVARRNH